MANPLTDYLRETRTELRHVAWPTRTQTMVYAILVAALSVGVAIYLGFFDYLFTTGVRHMLSSLPGSAPSAQVQPATSPITVTQTPAAPKTK